jgi:hypothetical protein
LPLHSQNRKMPKVLTSLSLSTFGSRLAAGALFSAGQSGAGTERQVVDHEFASGTKKARHLGRASWHGAHAESGAWTLRHRRQLREIGRELGLRERPNAKALAMKPLEHDAWQAGVVVKGLGEILIQRTRPAPEAWVGVFVDEAQCASPSLDQASYRGLLTPA